MYILKLNRFHSSQVIQIVLFIENGGSRVGTSCRSYQSWRTVSWWVRGEGLCQFFQQGTFFFSLILGRSKVLVLSFGPKMNTNVAFNTHTHPPTTTITLNSFTSSRHSRRLKLEEIKSQKISQQILKSWALLHLGLFNCKIKLS